MVSIGGLYVTSAQEYEMVVLTACFNILVTLAFGNSLSSIDVLIIVGLIEEW